MCGSFTLFDIKDILETGFTVEIPPDLFKPSYYIAPIQNLLVLYASGIKEFVLISVGGYHI